MSCSRGRLEDAIFLAKLLRRAAMPTEAESFDLSDDVSADDVRDPAAKHVIRYYQKMFEWSSFQNRFAKMFLDTSSHGLENFSRLSEILKIAKTNMR